MTTSDPERPPQPFGRTEYPSLENPAPQPDPNPPVDYPADAGLPPPIYPPPIYPPPYPGVVGYPGYPGYYQGGYDPYRPTKPPGTNGKAIAALVTSLVGLFCCGLPSIVGLILGVIAMRETKRTGQDGYAMAMIGAIIGGLAVAGWLLYLLLSIGIYASGRQWAP
jgi:uncharacterized membrane protein YeaQ/YmgE (transglycosylase-associated protein family)